MAAGLEEAGGSVATLKNIVNDGKLSSEAFFRAFIAGMPTLEAAAAKAQGTVSQAMTRIGNAFITGDAAGLATRDMAEGIGPAIRSSLRAAESILHGAPYQLDDVTGASLGGGLATRLFDWAMTRGAGRAGTHRLSAGRATA